MCWRLGPAGVGWRAWDPDSEGTGPRWPPHSHSRAEAAHGAGDRVAGVWGREPKFSAFSTGIGPRGRGVRSGERGLRAGVRSVGPGLWAEVCGGPGRPQPRPTPARRKRGFPQSRPPTPPAGAASSAGYWGGGEGGALLTHRGLRSVSGPPAGPGGGCSLEKDERALTWPEAPGVSQDWAGRLRPPPTPGPSEAERLASSSWRPGS